VVVDFAEMHVHVHVHAAVWFGSFMTAQRGRPAGRTRLRGI